MKVINGSEIAALLGEDQFNSPEEVLEKIKMQSNHKHVFVLKGQKQIRNFLRNC